MSVAPRERPLLAVAGLSASIFLLEVLLTRIFSVTLFHHFAFAAISMGMLGLAASGVRVSLAPARFTAERAGEDVPVAIGLFAATTLLAVGILVQVGVFPRFSWEQAARIALVYAVCFVPFYFGGLALSLIITHHRERFARLYASDLVAAGAAGLAVFPLLRWLGGPSAAVAAVMIALLASLAAYPDLRAPLRRRLWLVAAFGLAVIAADASWGVLELRRPKGAAAPSRILYEAWNALSRVAVYDVPEWPWSLGPRYRGPVAPGLRMDIDAAAATPIVSPAAGPGNGYLLYELTAVGHAVAPKGRVLVIGAGGGRDVLAALLGGVAHVDAVEINPIIVDDVMRGRFRGASGALYEDPRVSVHVGDGRTFVRRSADRYDLILLSLVDTWAATAAGAFALSENNLYTIEATEEYVRHLTPEGVLAITRWTGGETYRLVVLVHAAARSLGIEDPGRHLAVLQHREVPEAENAIVTLLFRRVPFDAAAGARLREQVERAGFVWLHDPLAPLPGRTSAMARAADALEEARRTEDYDLSPPTDDRPFFFYRPRPFFAGIRGAPSRLFTEGQYLVAEVMALSALLGFACILLPLWRAGRAALRSGPRAALLAIPYYVCLGVGFMLVEVSLMQRFVLFLGHPTHAMTAVVAGLLVGAGVGSALAGWPWAAGGGARAALAAALATGVLLASDVAQRALFARAQSLPFAAKLALTLAVVLPMGAALGTLMPVGIAKLVERAPGLVPWAWGINGFASVVGACACALCSMSFGFSRTFRLGAVCYAFAAVVALLEERASGCSA